MPSEFIQQQIDTLLKQASASLSEGDLELTAQRVRMILRLDSENANARSLEAMLQGEVGSESESRTAETAPVSTTDRDTPTSFANGRYEVKSMLGEGGKKKVYLAHDTTLDRDVAFGLIKAEGLDADSRQRITREAQAMARLGDHPNLMPIFDLGEENGQPYMVQPLMVGGDVEALIAEAEDGRLALEDALRISIEICRGLEFAHGKGIIHRDLKPGNVWLTDDGTVRIGDFGLALSLDRSRLTQEKMIVGTVSYMPPEQATGGEVTAQADLYSLGAMLYEMVTGRPPFMGDDDIGIIGQHINTPPVAPSWHNKSLPQTLDALIMRLLSKDPAERPESATELLQALEAIDPAEAAAAHAEEQGSLDSMSGGVFVGRHREMDQLKAMFEETLAGHGKMAALVGEPGIGKTRTAQELATYASMRGGQVLWGRCYEGGGAPPYYPWVQAIRSYVMDRNAETIRQEMGSTASVIAEIVPDVKEQLPDLPSPPKLDDPESARFRLFDSITTFLKSASVSQPIVLMLEDLHWSDKPSLLLLEFVARELGNSRLMIVGNYRDMELNRRHPLSVTLGELSRERLFDRVLLRGLQKHDVRRFIEVAAGIDPPGPLVDAVFTQTEGNPLFVTETVRLLIQEGDITSGADARGGTSSWEIRIPEGVREVIGRRLDRLSERCNEVLTTAAVVGRQFRFEVLMKLVEDTSENMLLDVRDEALEARIVEEVTAEVGLYQFAHALMQETLTSELSANRTVRLHARIAQAVEQYYGTESDSHAAELVVHFAEAETILGPEAVVRDSQLAGDQSLTGHAFEAAADHFRRALDSVPADDIGMEAELHFGLARALMSTAERSEMQSVVDQILAAFNGFINSDNLPAALRVAQIVVPNVQGSTGKVEMLERALKIAGSDELVVANIHASLTRWYRLESYDLDAMRSSARIALEIARKHGDTDLEFRVLADVSQNDWDANDSQGYMRRLEELSVSIDLPVAEASYYMTVGFGLLVGGKIAESRVALDNQIAAAERTHNSWEIAVAYANRAAPHIFRGEWEQAIALAREGEQYAPNEGRLRGVISRCAFETGDFELGLGAIDLDGPFSPNGIRTVVWAFFMTEQDYVSDSLNRLAVERTGDQRQWGTTTFSQIAWLNLGWLAALRNDKAGAQEAIKNLNVANIHALDVRLAISEYSIRGMIFAAVGDVEQSVKFAETARENAIALGHIPQQGWTAYLESKSLLDRDGPGDREKATELQDEAIATATELGMKPLLERVLTQREMLKA